MRGLEDGRETLRGTGGAISNAWESFSNFALNDNVLEVAIGLIIASAFNKVVTSFVSDILLPPFSLLPFVGRNLDEKFAVLKKGPHYNELNGYNTVTQASEDGAVTLSYGTFIDRIVNFLAIALALFFAGKMYGWLSNDTVIKRSVKCKYCRKRISEKAKRCVNCTSWQDGREDE
ncbi:MAG: hypothetical protein MMC23_001163 [Stictis urceolatum]|nr:hypothetical protein [Stictis urceolata]